MRGVLTALAAKRPSAGLSARNRRPERNRRKKNCPTDADAGRLPFINNHRSVRPAAGSRDRASDSAKYPKEVARFLAQMLINDARSR